MSLFVVFILIVAVLVVASVFRYLDAFEASFATQLRRAEEVANVDV